MMDYRAEFLEMCIENHILRFGEFTLKSGRISPYFFNAGLFSNGVLLNQLSSAYARLIVENFSHNFMLYGPAYKGIPLVAATSMQLAQNHQLNIPYAFNRKEIKDHGEGGNTVGAKLSGKVIIVDDVITAGTSANESIEIISASGAEPCAIVIALDRQETVDGESLSAIQKIEQQYDIPVLPIIKLEDLIEYLQTAPTFRKYHRDIRKYREVYGLTNRTG